MRLAIKILAALLFLAIATSAIAGNSTDNFNRTDNADLGTAWDVYNSAACQIVNNQAGGSTGGTRCSEGYNTLVPGNPQYSQAVISDINDTGSGMDVNVIVRLQAPTTYSGYLCRAIINGTPDTALIQRRDAGSGTDIANDGGGITWAIGDVIRCEASGSTITLYRNGVSVLSVVDAAYASGRGGIAILLPASSNYMRLDDFDVGDLGAATRRSQGVVVFP